MAKPKTMSDPMTVRVPLELWPLLVSNAAKHGRNPAEHVSHVITEALRTQMAKSTWKEPPEGAQPACNHDRSHPKITDPATGYVVCECGSTYAAGMGWNYDLKTNPRPAVATVWPIK